MIFLRDYFLWPIVTLRLITRPIWKSSRNNIIFFNTIILCFCVFILALLDHFHHFVSSDDSGRASHQRTVTERLIRWQWQSVSSDEWQSISSDDSDRASHQMTVTERLIRWQWQSVSSDDSDRASHQMTVTERLYFIIDMYVNI